VLGSKSAREVCESVRHTDGGDPNVKVRGAAQIVERCEQLA
jgi:hypothetical protein